MTDIIRKRGDTVADEITVTDAAGAPRDITGYLFLLTVNTLVAPPLATTQLFQMVGTILDAPNGLVEFAPSLADSDQKATTYYYDIQMTLPSGRIKTIDEGEYVFTQDITK